MADGKQIVIGLMSGTSVDAVDAALIETDGKEYIRPIAAVERPYSAGERALIRTAAQQALALDAPQSHPLIEEAQELLTEAHAEAIALLEGAKNATLIGFHGQTVAHRPPSSGHASPFTWQIGDAGLLAARTGISVVSDFRSADVAAGGEGAPLAPGFHRALAHGLEQPMAVLNLGGVGNITWFSEGSWGAFDTGPANALIDDWVARHGAGTYDRDGLLAAAGTIDEGIVQQLARGSYFEIAGPKSLDRDDFSGAAVEGMSLEDGAATLTAFTAESVRRCVANIPVPLKRLLVTGGGRRNPALMAMLGDRLSCPVAAVEEIGWDGDALEAQAFGWLAVRSVAGLPISWPETTGVPQPLSGGRLTPVDLDYRTNRGHRPI